MGCALAEVEQPGDIRELAVEHNMVGAVQGEVSEGRVGQGFAWSECYLVARRSAINDRRS